MLCYKCSQNIPDYSLVCPNCGAEMSAKARTMHQMGNMGMPMGFPMPMTWFRLLVGFYLFVEAFSFATSGIDAITGFMHAALPDAEGLILSFADISKKLKFIDIIYGIICIGFAVFAIVTRSKLAKFKKEAPVFVLLFFLIPPIVNAIYSIALMIMSKMPLMAYYSVVFQLAFQGAIVYANYVYFKKRKHLFKN